jgi:hypothetical protein
MRAEPCNCCYCKRKRLRAQFIEMEVAALVKAERERRQRPGFFNRLLNCLT